jgi:hypothetical protein
MTNLVYVFVCVCVCSERQRERESNQASKRGREGRREGGTEGERDEETCRLKRGLQHSLSSLCLDRMSAIYFMSWRRVRRQVHNPFSRPLSLCFKSQCGCCAVLVCLSPPFLTYLTFPLYLCSSICAASFITPCYSLDVSLLLILPELSYISISLPPPPLPQF